jgi:hypothetical protein
MSHVRRGRIIIPAALLAVALAAAPVTEGAPGKVVGRTRVEQVFKPTGVVFYPSALVLGHTRLITGGMPHTVWPRVSVFIFKTPPEAQKLSDFHTKHPTVLLSRNDIRGTERTLLFKNLLVVWPTRSPAKFTAAVTTAVQALLPHPHPHGKRKRRAA